MAILLARGDPATSNDTVQLTSRAETAGLIEQLRTADITLTYDPDTKTIRTHGSDPREPGPLTAREGTPRKETDR